jgi:hypothetical protein
MNTQDRRDLWRARIAAAAAHSRSARAWCFENGVRPRQLYYWRSHLKELSCDPQECEWLPVQVTDPPAAPASDCITLKIAGAEIDLRCDFNPSLLRLVVNALTVQPC